LDVPIAVKFDFMADLTGTGNRMNKLMFD